MKRLSLFVLLLAIVTPLAMAGGQKNKASDPVVMTVGGMDVRLSEFEYLYKKNNAQQASSISLDDYIEMFVNYKLKVRAAMAAGLDTTAGYLSDMARYSAELASPYLVDGEMRDSLVKVAYDHRCQAVTVRHLLLPSGQRALADSLRKAVVSGGASFEDIVGRYSVDPMAKSTGGVLTITGGMLPYAFEDVAYNVAEGEMSPVFETQFGTHLLKVQGRRPDPGEVKVRHILVRHVDGDPGRALARIDSIHALILQGADFRQTASQFTEDPSGRDSGGDLPWFGIGRMIPEFESTAFALADGSVSEPVRTMFGYHILLREGSRPTPTLDSLRTQIEHMIDTDYRHQLMERRTSDIYGRSIGVKTYGKTDRKVAGVFGKCGGLNSESRSRLAKMASTALTVGGRDVTVAEVVAGIPASITGDADEAMTAYEQSRWVIRYSLLRESQLATLADREPDYRNLINEYSDGMLLFEISNREVWDRANTDTEGLEAFFAAHRDSYAWDVPHYNGFVITAVSDSIADAACEYLDELRPDQMSIATELRKRFGNNVKADRVIAGRGANAVVDHVAFGAPAPAANGRWVAWRQWNGGIFEQPVSALDVKGAVSIDYQQQLEAEWMERLRATYPVVIHRERLASLR